MSDDPSPLSGRRIQLDNVWLLPAALALDLLDTLRQRQPFCDIVPVRFATHGRADDLSHGDTNGSGLVSQKRKIYIQTVRLDQGSILSVVENRDEDERIPRRENPKLFGLRCGYQASKYEDPFGSGQ